MFKLVFAFIGWLNTKLMVDRGECPADFIMKYELPIACIGCGTEHRCEFPY